MIPTFLLTSLQLRSLFLDPPPRVLDVTRRRVGLADTEPQRKAVIQARMRQVEIAAAI